MTNDFKLTTTDKKLSKIILPFRIFRNPNPSQIKLTLHILTVAITLNPTINSITYRVAEAHIVSHIFSYTLLGNRDRLSPPLKPVVAKLNLPTCHIFAMNPSLLSNSRIDTKWRQLLRSSILINLLVYRCF